VMDKKITSAKRCALIGVCTSCALVLSYVEVLLPPISAAAPGIKIGLANIMTVFALYRFGLKPAVAVSSLRIILSSLLFGSVVSFVYSVIGGVLSLAVMTLLKYSDRMSVVGVSAVGGVVHNAGQILGAVLLMKTAEISYYFPILAISGTVAGICVGIIGAVLLKTLRNVKLY